jgi:hypothetical protein
VADVLGHRYSVRTAKRARLLGRSDADHFAHCWRTGRVLITHDFDFWDYQNPEVPDTRNPGVIVFACDNGDSAGIDATLGFLPRVCDLVGPFGWRDTRVVVGPKGAVRIRRRDQKSGNYEIEEYRVGRAGTFKRKT